MANLHAIYLILSGKISLLPVNTATESGKWLQAKKKMDLSEIPLARMNFINDSYL